MGARQSVAQPPRQRPPSGVRETSGSAEEAEGRRTGRSLSVPSHIVSGRQPDSAESSDGDGPSASMAVPPSLDQLLHRRRHGGPHSATLPTFPFPFRFFDIRCPVCNKMVPSDDAECHLVMCLTRPRITYNEDVLTEDIGECVVCLEEMNQGDTIARLPCLCVYHKSCIDNWFRVKNVCPGHPGDD